MEVAEGCIPDQNRPLVPILASAEAGEKDTSVRDIDKPPIPGRGRFRGSLTRRIQISHSLEAILIVKRVGERQRSAHGDITGFEIRRFSNGDLHAADSQVNCKYVQIDVGTLTDSLSPNIHRSMAITSIIRFACFRLLSDHSLFNRVLPEGLLWQGLWGLSQHHQMGVKTPDLRRNRTGQSVRESQRAGLHDTPIRSGSIPHPCTYEKQEKTKKTMASLGRGELLLNHESPSNGGWLHRKNDVINGSETSVGRARAMMSEFAVAPDRAMGAIIGPPGEAMEELDSPYRCCAGRADRARQGNDVHDLQPQENAGPTSSEIYVKARNFARNFCLSVCLSICLSVYPYTGFSSLHF
ncbi:hypothetical protein THAOC_27337 [Thalassiosira oceanica]|uniref:Uncharacterized protein n=1 Tax=Thalassiosira oceanica TaxID=159749 RepID=K0RHT9_THAOC|nr:hypothetical protein THAOC_27337 [Thalassiosira oceanica]|eukprot:EJK53258.1 hypothetical protein THAOC_27337 [Thalassiosira oceanica]